MCQIHKFPDNLKNICQRKLIVWYDKYGSFQAGMVNCYLVKATGADCEYLL